MPHISRKYLYLYAENILNVSRANIYVVFFPRPACCGSLYSLNTGWVLFIRWKVRGWIRGKCDKYFRFYQSSIVTIRMTMKTELMDIVESYLRWILKCRRRTKFYFGKTIFKFKKRNLFSEEDRKDMYHHWNLKKL